MVAVLYCFLNGEVGNFLKLLDSLYSVINPIHIRNVMFTVNNCSKFPLEVSYYFFSNCRVWSIKSNLAHTRLQVCFIC